MAARSAAKRKHQGETRARTQPMAERDLAAQADDLHEPQRRSRCIELLDFYQD